MEGICEALYRNTYESFAAKLWKLAGWVTSQPAELPEKTEVDEIVNRTLAMVKGAHFFLHHKERLGFEDSDIDRVWVPNPYRMPDEYRSRFDHTLNYHFAHREERFRWLTQDEVQNFSLVFKHFFSLLSLGDWINILEDWRLFALDSDPVSQEADFTPLKTYEQLAKLSEACFVALEWNDGFFPPPNQHLCLHYLKHYNHDGFDAANPLRDINWLFYEYDIKCLKKDVTNVFAICKHEKAEISRSLGNLTFCLVCLLYSGWLLLQTDKYPEEWINPDKFDFIQYPKIDVEFSQWGAADLDYEQNRNPVQALWQLFRNVDLGDERAAIEFILARYYDPKAEGCLPDGSVDTKRFFLKLLDILFLINLDLCQKRTIQDNVKYPESYRCNEDAVTEPAEAEPTSQSVNLK